MPIFIQTTRHVIEISQITHIHLKQAVADIFFAGGTKLTVPIDEAAELREAMDGKALAGLIKCIATPGYARQDTGRKTR